MPPTADPPRVPLGLAGSPDPATTGQLQAVARDPRVRAAALMADAHPGVLMPVGGVAAYAGAVSVTGVGPDIGCGVQARRLDVRARDLRDKDWARLADRLERRLAFGAEPVLESGIDADHAFFEDPAWAAVPGARARGWLRELAHTQLGTVGGGNHYVDVLIDPETDHLWIAAHFGSRGLGAMIARGVMNLDQGQGWEARPALRHTVLDLGTPLGDAYWALMTLAGDYAQLGRTVVLDQVERLIGPSVETLDTRHNFAWMEPVEGVPLVVVRKGATRARPHERGFVGGSMGDPAAIVVGADPAPHAPPASDDAAAVTRRQAELLYSTVHGAGRVMSRRAAGGERSRSGRLLAQGQVTPRMYASWQRRSGVTVIGGGLDEAPMAYRELGPVLAAQGSTITVERRLVPRIVAMAGPGAEATDDD